MFFQGALCFCFCSAGGFEVLLWEVFFGELGDPTRGLLMSNESTNDDKVSN